MSLNKSSRHPSSSAQAETLFVHWVGDTPHWVAVDRQGQVLESGVLESDDNERQLSCPSARHVVVLFDAALASPLTLDLPPMPANRQAQALQWAAEEFVAGPIEEEHVVAGPRSADGELFALTMARETMGELFASIEHLSPDQLMPDALCLPYQDGQLSLAESNGRVLLRWGRWSFGAFNASTAALMLDQFQALDWVWYGQQAPSASLDETLSGRLSRVGEDRSLLELLIPQAGATEINMLTGPWQPDAAKRWRGEWRWVAGLAFAVCVLATGLVAVEQHLLARQANQLQAEVTETFQSLFPGQRAMGRERELLARELARLQYGQAAGLMELMGWVGPVIAAQSNLRVESLNYRSGELELSVSAPDVASLDAVGQQLRSLDLEASVQSATLSGQGANGRVIVRRGGS